MTAFPPKRVFTDKSVAPGPPHTDAEFFNTLQDAVIAAGGPDDARPPTAHNHDTIYPHGDPSGAVDGYDWTYDAASNGWLPKPKVPTTRKVNTNAPLSGGGDLSADRTLSIAIDPVASTAGARTLGSGAQQAAAGNDPRFPIVPTKLGYCTFGGTGDGSGTVGLSPRTDLTNFHQRDVFHLPVRASRFRIKIRNYQLRAETAYTGAVNITGGYIGAQAPDANGERTGNFSAAPTQIFGAGTLAADGSEWVSDWIMPSTFTLAACGGYVLSIGFTCAAGQQIAQASNKAYVGSTSGQANAVTNPITGFSNQSFAMMIEYEFAANNPVGIAFGDSITEGTATRLGQRHNYLTQYGLSTGCVPIVSGIGGSQANDWINSGGLGYKYSRFDNRNPNWSLDFALIFLGRNDLSAGRTDTQIQANLQVIINFVRNNLNPKRLYLATILPTSSSGWSTQQETYRRSVNAWIRTLLAGAVSVLDFEKELFSDNRGSAQLSVAGRGDWSSTANYSVDDVVAYRGLYWRATAANTNSNPVFLANWQQIYAMNTDHDSGDGIHPNESGQARLAKLIPVVSGVAA